MARAILLVAAIGWLAAGVVAGVIAAVGAEALERLLPPLAIDTDALRGAITAVAVGLVGLGVVHGLVLVGMRAAMRPARTAAILLSAVLATLLVALAVAAITSAVVDPSNAGWLAVGAAAAGIGAVGYGLVTVRLVAEHRSLDVG